MKRKRFWIVGLVSALALLLTLALAANPGLAQGPQPTEPITAQAAVGTAFTYQGHLTNGGYDLTWSTIDGGGYTFSTGGSYSLGSTAGQPDAGALSGGSYTLGGGFWGGGSALSPGSGAVYLPIILKSY